MAILVKIHKSSCRDVVAICDADLIGKKFEEAKNKKIFQIDLTGNFFKGDEKTPDEAAEVIRMESDEDACFNIVGKKSCDLCLQCKLISKKGITEINKIPVAFVLM